MAWIGSLGNLVEVKCPSAQRLTRDHRVTVKTTLAGTDKAFTEPVGPAREWDLDVSAATPRDLAALDLTLSGAWGPGPFVFVDPWAEQVNLVSPNGTAFKAGVTGGTLSGAFTGEDGFRHPASLVASSGNVYFAQNTPVVPGVKVTGSVYATNGTKVHLHIRNAAGTILTNLSTVAIREGQRVYLTATAPAGAASARLAVAADAGAGTVAGPAITWTSALTDYFPGQGAPQVIPTGSALTVLRAAATQRLAAQAVTLRELRGPNA